MRSESRDPTRRDFLATSAVGLIALARGSERPAWGGEIQTHSNLLYVGTYTEGTGSEGVYLVRFDPRSGKLRRVGSANVGANPSFLTVHPNGRVLYAVNEVGQYMGKATGAVGAFAIAKETGALTRLNEQPSGGAGPCYASVDHTGRLLLAANYDAGTLSVFPIEHDGSLAPAAQVLQHTGTGPNKERQEKAHAHCIIPDPSNRFAVSADLGTDRVYAYGLDVAGRAIRHVEGGDAMMRPGAGPRHLAFHPRLPSLYVANEIDSTVGRIRFDAGLGKLSLVDSHSTLPAEWKGANDVADIHVASSGRTLYVSNRGHNSIAVFNVAATTGALSLEQFVATENWPRNFSLDPSERWLLAANEKSNSVVVFARDQRDGRLSATGERLEIPSPVCLRFLTPRS